MNLKRIRIFAKRAILIVLTMIVIAGATGFSYKAHYCHGNLSGIAFFTELGLQKPVSCGCKEDLIRGKVYQSNGSSSVITKNGCCSNLSYFSKLHIQSNVPGPLTSAPVQPISEVIIFDNTLLSSCKREVFSLSDFVFRPPPLAGRKLVLFLSQQRIPLISYSC